MRVDVERVDSEAVHPTRDATRNARVMGRVDGFPVHAFRQRQYSHKIKQRVF